MKYDKRKNRVNEINKPNSESKENQYYLKVYQIISETKKKWNFKEGPYKKNTVFE